MDGDDLASEPSDPQSIAEIFASAFPYYLSMGMTYEEFWLGPPTLVRDYRKAHTMRRQERNYEMWMQGRYIFEALHGAPLVVGFPRKGSEKDAPGYPNEPYPLSEKEAKERKERDARERYYKMRAKLMAEAKASREKKAEASAKKEASEDGGD